MKWRMVSLAVLPLLVCAITVAEEGWVDLFNGSDLEGWEQKGGEAKYKVEDGAVVGVSVPNTENSFLCTKQHYANFILELEVFANPEMNSGIQFRSNSLPDFKDGRVHGYQCEVEDENQGREWFGGIYDEGRRGWLFPTKEDEAWGKKFGEAGKSVWKNGEWNTIRIEAQGDSIKTFINGQPRADLKDGMSPSGFIALQVHGVGDRKEPLPVKWRKIRIKVLD